MRALSTSLLLPPSVPDLVALAREGSGDALSALYSRYGRRLMALAYRLTGSRSDAEDALHDVFLGLPEALHRYDERGAFESWLMRIAARVALTRVRGRERTREVPLDEALLKSSGDRMNRLGDLLAVQRAIDALPEKLRVVFVLREIEGYAHAEIGELLDITANASEVRLHRAMRMLRLTLGANHERRSVRATTARRGPLAADP